MRWLGLASVVVSCAVSRAPQVAPAATAAVTRPPPAPAASSAAAEPRPPPPPRSPFAYANVDPSDDDVVGPPDVRATCDDDLAAAKIVWQKATLPIFVQKKSKITCGAPQVVTYKGSPAKIAWSPSVLITCTMALSLARFELAVQEEAKRAFGSPVVRIQHLGTYNCREMAAYPGWVSEHSYANAIDVAELHLQNGTKVEVLHDFRPKDQTTTDKKATFLRAIARRGYDDEIFSTVLTPFFNADHANHFHLDLARFRNDGAFYGAK